jgi:hypothetical protein
MDARAPATSMRLRMFMLCSPVSELVLRSAPAIPPLIRLNFLKRGKTDNSHVFVAEY